MIYLHPSPDIRRLTLDQRLATLIVWCSVFGALMIAHAVLIGIRIRTFGMYSRVLTTS